MSVRDTVQLYSTIHKALDERKAICMTYITEGVTPKARVVMPERLQTAKNGADLIFGWDSIRGTRISLRVDRIAPGAHLIG
jgi:predicted DNA-binding transcriptional regulator YafY